MAKAELKTQKTEESVDAFVKKIADAGRRKDAAAIVKLMEQATKAKGKMWGPAIIGFGECVLKYDSGRVLDWFQVGFSPRKQNFALYGMGSMIDTPLIKKLGKVKHGKGCIYINSLEEVDTAVLKQMLEKSVAQFAKKK